MGMVWIGRLYFPAMGSSALWMRLLEGQSSSQWFSKGSQALGQRSVSQGQAAMV
jgi:hypothetical protein